MTEWKPWPLYKRFQFQIGIRFDLMPNKAIPFKEWFWSPHFVLTRIGDKITSRLQMPEDIGSFFADHDENKNILSRFFWTSAAIRILGFDIGAGFLYLNKNFGNPN